MKLHYSLFLAAISLLGRGCNESSLPADVPDNAFDLSGHLVFSAQGGGSSLPDGVYAVDLSGMSATLRLVASGGSDMRASADGTMLTYTKFSPQQSQDIYTILLSGGSEANVTNRPQVSEYFPDISTAGSLIVFSAFFAPVGPTAICCVDRSGGMPFTLTDTLDHSARAWYPRLSPDESAVAYIRSVSPGGQYAVSLVGIDGSNPRDLADCGTTCPPTWSLDGRYLAYEPPAGSVQGVPVWDMQSGTKRTVVGGGTLNANGCAWTQAGELYCFGKMPEDSLFDIYRARSPLFHMPEKIEGDFHQLSTLLCAPDGNTIGVIGRRKNEGLSLYVMKPDGSLLTKVVQLSTSGDVQDGGFAQWVK